MTSEGPVTANSMVVCREEFDDWGILFDPETGKCFGINPAAVFIWKRLNGKNYVEDISREMESSFEDMPENAEADIRDFIKDLVQSGFAGYEV